MHGGAVKVAVVAHGVADQSLLGGPGRVASEHAKGLAARGHEVRVVTTDIVSKTSRARPPTFELTAADGVTVRWARARTLRGWPGTIGPVFSREARPLIEEVVGWADVVHAHDWPYRLVQTTRRLAVAAGKPVLVQPHGSIQARRGPRRLLHASFNTFHRLGSQYTRVEDLLDGA